MNKFTLERCVKSWCDSSSCFHTCARWRMSELWHVFLLHKSHIFQIIFNKYLINKYNCSMYNFILFHTYYIHELLHTTKPTTYIWDDVNMCSAHLQKQNGGICLIFCRLARLKQNKSCLNMMEYHFILDHKNGHDLQINLEVKIIGNTWHFTKTIW